MDAWSTSSSTRISKRTWRSCTITWGSSRSVSPLNNGPSGPACNRGGSTMKVLQRSLLALGIAAALGTGAAQAQISDNVIKIGVLSDMSSLYTDIGGAGSVVAARMAVKDSG